MIGFDVRSVARKDCEDIIRLNSNIDFSAINSVIESEDFKIIVAQLNDEVIGYIKFQILSDASYKKNLSINDIVVDEKYRGLGVGHQLMIEAEKYALDYNAAFIVAINNNYKEEEAEFYNRQGFKLNKERRYEKQSYIQ